MTTRGRYAPSPTGPLHLGNLRTALLAWLQVRRVGGVFVLRMEDLDRPRVVPGSAQQLLDDLRWLGLDWDEGPEGTRAKKQGPEGGPFGPYTQSERDHLYEAALAALIERGDVFRCWCSRRDIAEAASAPHGASPIYPGTCRDLNEAQHAQRQAEKPDRVPAWRFRVRDTTITFRDELCGEVTQRLADEVGDFVVRRADGLFAYQLAVVVDDLAMQITDVVRGEDLLDSTPRQIALARALGGDPPRYWHVPMMLDEAGERLSKRDGSRSLAELRAAGWTPERVVGHLAATLGWAQEGALLRPHDLLEVAW